MKCYRRAILIDTVLLLPLVFHHASSLSFGLSSLVNKNNKNTFDLGKKSSALDVLKTLNRQDALAPYVREGGTAVITGGASGIGASCVETLALAGMKVILCARNVDAAEEVRAAMTNGGEKNVHVQRLDLADLRSIDEAARMICETPGGIDVILNNAGVMATPQRMETAQGFELQFGTNHVGHHMLTRLLLPCMRNGGRVVTVASTAHTMGELEFSDLNYTPDTTSSSSDRRIYTPWGAYGQSKLANVLFAKALNDRLQGTKKDITAVSLHPGVIKTNLWRYSPRLLQPLTGLFADKTVEQGAATSVYCSMVDSDLINGGDYYSDCGATTPNKSGEDVDGKLRNQLWDETEKLIQDAGFELPTEIV